MKCEFDVNMSVSSLYDFNMYHYYTGVTGVVGSAAGALLFIVYAAYRQPAYLLCGLIMLFYGPVSLFVSAGKQIKLNPVYKHPMHYVMDDEGVTVTAGEESLTVSWSDMYKARSTPQSILLYTGLKNAWIFPKRDLGSARYDVIEAISTHMDPSRVKIRQ